MDFEVPNDMRGQASNIDIWQLAGCIDILEAHTYSYNEFHSIYSINQIVRWINLPLTPKILI